MAGGIVEIEQKHSCSNNGDADDHDDDTKTTMMMNKVEITVRSIGPSPTFHLRVSSPIKDSSKPPTNPFEIHESALLDEQLVHDLRKLIAYNGKRQVENMKLIIRGNVLQDSQDGEDKYIQLKDGDSIIVAVKPKPPAKHIRNGSDDDEDSDDDDMKFQLPSSASRWQRKFFSFLRDKLKLPHMLLNAIYALTLKMWIIISIWFILAPVANRYELGPLYILATGFALIFLNLGKRRHGDVSAYSIFNEDFRELPGTLNADRLDRDLRAGQF